MSHTVISSSVVGSVMSVMSLKAVGFEWKIPKFLDLLQPWYEDTISCTFLFSDTEWLIGIYPALGKDVSLCILKNRSPCVLRVSYSTAVLKADGSVFKSVCGINVFEKGGVEVNTSGTLSILMSELITAKDIVLPEGTLTVFVSLCILNQTGETTSVNAACQTPPSDGFETLSQNLKKLYLSGTEGDITFQVKDKQISAHKLILAARSTVFEAMFKADMTEKNNSSVNISDSVPEHFEKFLLYLYTGELNVVSPTNASGLYYLADKYNLKELKEICCQILTREINVDSFCDAAVLAFLHDEVELLEAATEFFIKYANDIFPTPKWASFVAEHFTLANELLIKMANKYCVKQL